MQQPTKSNWHRTLKVFPPEHRRHCEAKKHHHTLRRSVPPTLPRAFRRRVPSFNPFFRISQCTGNKQPFQSIQPRRYPGWLDRQPQPRHHRTLLDCQRLYDHLCQSPRPMCGRTCAWPAHKAALDRTQPAPGTNECRHAGRFCPRAQQSFGMDTTARGNNCFDQSE